jgi:phytoene dehydrogenase-like protein
MPSSDVIIIGGGTNGLACAARLAQAGRRVTLVESRAEPGGGALGWEFHPGFRSPGLAHVLHLLDRRVAAAMDLTRHGLTLAVPDLATTALGPDGRHLLLRGAFGASIAGDLAQADRDAWPRLRARLLRFAAALAPFKEITPPRLAAGNGNLTQLAWLGLAIRRLGREDFREFLRLALINIWDVLEDELSDDRLKGCLAFDATLGSWLGPRSPNTLILLLNRLAGAISDRAAILSLPAGGMGSVAAAMSRSAAASGVTIRCTAPVRRIIVSDGRASGVVLDDGQELHAASVVSAINPVTTLASLVGPDHLDTGLLMRLRRLKSRGAAARLHLALRALPDFRGADLATRLVIAPSGTAVDRASNAVKYGEVPREPVMEVILPSVTTDTLAPPGQHVLSAIVQFAPHAPKAGPDAARAELLGHCLDTLETHAPGLRSLILGAELLLPGDIEARFGFPGGNWHHGELSVEQMFFLRPVPVLSRYRTPVDGLWLASAGSHPGGGISGAPGWNAAGEILRDSR